MGDGLSFGVALARIERALRATEVQLAACADVEEQARLAAVIEVLKYAVSDRPTDQELMSFVQLRGPLFPEELRVLGICRLLKRCEPGIYRCARRLQVDADDLMQEVWIRVLRSADTYKPTGSAVGWILKIATNTGIRQQRSPRRRPCDDIEDSNLPPVSPRQQLSVELEEMRRLLLAFLERIPPDRRELWLRRIEDGDSYDDIAADLGESAGTLRVRFLRLMKAWDLYLAKLGFAEPDEEAKAKAKAEEEAKPKAKSDEDAKAKSRAEEVAKAEEQR